MFPGDCQWGYLMRPYFTKEIRAPGIRGAEVSGNCQAGPLQRYFCEGNANNGRSGKDRSGINASIEGYRIAGNGDGTKVGPDGAYLGGDYILSFIGFAPAEDPQIVLL